MIEEPICICGHGIFEHNDYDFGKRCCIRCECAQFEEADSLDEETDEEPSKWQDWDEGHYP